MLFDLKRNSREHYKNEPYYTTVRERKNLKMATNSSRGNPIAARDGPQVETSTSPISANAKSQIRDTSSSTDPITSEHAAGQEKESLQNQSEPEAEMKREMERLGKP